MESNGDSLERILHFLNLPFYQLNALSRQRNNKTICDNFQQYRIYNNLQCFDNDTLQDLRLHNKYLDARNSWRSKFSGQTDILDNIFGIILGFLFVVHFNKNLLSWRSRSDSYILRQLQFNKREVCKFVWFECISFLWEILLNITVTGAEVWFTPDQCGPLQVQDSDGGS